MVRTVLLIVALVALLKGLATLLLPHWRRRSFELSLGSAGFVRFGGALGVAMAAGLWWAAGATTGAAYLTLIFLAALCLVYGLLALVCPGSWIDRVGGWMRRTTERQLRSVVLWIGVCQCALGAWCFWVSFGA